jgi:hypothetical protein
VSAGQLDYAFVIAVWQRRWCLGFRGRGWGLSDVAATLALRRKRLCLGRRHVAFDQCRECSARFNGECFGGVFTPLIDAEGAAFDFAIGQGDPAHPIRAAAGFGLDADAAHVRVAGGVAGAKALGVLLFGARGAGLGERLVAKGFSSAEGSVAPAVGGVNEGYKKLLLAPRNRDPPGVGFGACSAVRTRESPQKRGSSGVLVLWGKAMIQEHSETGEGDKEHGACGRWGEERGAAARSTLGACDGVECSHSIVV